MKYVTVIITLLFLLPVLTCAQSGAQTSTSDTVVVKSVTGGTTFTTDDGRTITLLGLTVPKSQAITAADAKDHLAGMIEGESVIIISDSLAPADSKKGTFRYVYSGSTLVNSAMIEEGYAAPSATKHSLASSFKDIHTAAQSSHRGAYATERSTAVQCSATTQKGTQCKRMTTNLSGKCWQHE